MWSHILVTHEIEVCWLHLGEPSVSHTLRLPALPLGVPKTSKFSHQETSPILQLRILFNLWQHRPWRCYSQTDREAICSEFAPPFPPGEADRSSGSSGRRGWAEEGSGLIVLMLGSLSGQGVLVMMWYSWSAWVEIKSTCWWCFYRSRKWHVG